MLRSDKLAKWCLLGVQGALLSTLLEEPLYLQSLTVALPPSHDGLAPAAAAALQRAVAGASERDSA
jgi:tRNA-specific adenosine deaminase 1